MHFDIYLVRRQIQHPAGSRRILLALLAMSSYWRTMTLSVYHWRTLKCDRSKCRDGVRANGLSQAVRRDCTSKGSRSLSAGNSRSCSIALKNAPEHFSIRTTVWNVVEQFWSSKGYWQNIQRMHGGAPGQGCPLTIQASILPIQTP